MTDDNNDLYLDETGNIVIGNGRDAILQVVSNNIRTLLGEIQLDTSIGIPYFETVFLDKANIEVWESYITETALNVEGVLEVESLKTDVVNGILNFEIKLKTIYGDGTITGK